MKYNRVGTILLLATMLLLGGCGEKNAAGEISGNDEIPSGEVIEYTFLQEQDMEWRDNSLDELQAVYNIPIEEVTVKGEKIFRTHYHVRRDGVVMFKNHNMPIFRDSWSGVSGLTNEGGLFSEVITVDSERKGRQIDLLGPIAGGNGFVAYKYVIGETTNTICGQWFYVLDENFKKVNEFYIPEPLDSNPVNAVAGDSNGNIHVIHRRGGMEIYVIFSSEGEKIFETTVNDPHLWHELYPMDDGRVLVCDHKNGWLFAEADIDNNKMITLGLLEDKVIEKLAKVTAPVTSILAMMNDEVMVYCNGEGIYFYNVKTAEVRMAYKWANHGIAVVEIHGVYANEDGTIGLVYLDDDGVQYILLKPKFEETEITTVVFAVSPDHKNAYNSAVAAFNKKYPTYNIVMKEDYEETPLLTQLGAGEGPVIIDTRLTGFDTLQKLWQPLDGYLAKTGLMEELIPQALSFGQIEDNIYGIVTSFAIDSTLVKDPSLVGWDYNAFLDAVEQFDGAVFASNFGQQQVDARFHFFRELSRGLDDTVYLDREKGTVIFGTPEFKRILKLSDKANPCYHWDDGKALADGKVLYEVAFVSSIAQLVNLRMRLEEGGVYIAGLPTKNGARNILWSEDPLVIRSTATDEEKQVAFTFFRTLLSYDCALKAVLNNTSTYFSVREDVVQQQFERYEKVYMYNNEPAIDIEKESALFHELVENSIVRKRFPATLRGLVEQEFEAYVDGDIPADVLESRLKSRVSVFLDELQ